MWLRTPLLSHFASILSHLASLCGGTSGLNFASLLGQFNYFCVSVFLKTHFINIPQNSLLGVPCCNFVWQGAVPAPKQSPGHFWGIPTTEFLYVFLVDRFFFFLMRAYRVLGELISQRFLWCALEMRTANANARNREWLRRREKEQCRIAIWGCDVENR